MATLQCCSAMHLNFVMIMTAVSAQHCSVIIHLVLYLKWLFCSVAVSFILYIWFSTMCPWHLLYISTLWSEYVAVLQCPLHLLYISTLWNEYVAVLQCPSHLLYISTLWNEYVAVLQCPSLYISIFTDKIFEFPSPKMPGNSHDMSLVMCRKVFHGSYVSPIH